MQIFAVHIHRSFLTFYFYIDVSLNGMKILNTSIVLNLAAVIH
jgi:hypothetical protein